MTKTEKLNAHFAKWRQLTRAPIKNFHADGIVDEAAYDAAPVKLCFLMKEPNNPAKDDFGAKFDFREWWRNEPIKGTFTKRISEWSYGILNDFPPYDDIGLADSERATHEVRKSIALVNAKKTGGGGSSEYHSFMHAIGATEKQQDVVAELVREELRIIDPQVVIMGLRWGGLRRRLFPGVTWERSGYDVEVGEWEGCALIDFYHPSARTAPVAAYCLLEKVMNTDVYRKLAVAKKGSR